MDIRRNAPGARTLQRAFRAALVVGATAAPAVAQPAPPVERTPAQPAKAGEKAGEEAVRTFDAAYFRQYNPVTAGDMVSRLPGFEIDDGATLRGFGATAGNVLINGERLSSKVTATEQLKRIPADGVLRIELISGSTSNVDVRGRTQLANVVLKAGKDKNKTAWSLDARHIEYSDRIGWGVQVTRSFALGDNAELAVDFQAPNLRGRSESFETVRNAAGALTQYRKQLGQPNNIGLQGAATLKWRPSARDTVNINAQFAPTWNTTNIASFVYSPTNVFQQATLGFTDYDNNYTAEIAADWEHKFSPTLSMKALALVSSTSVDQNDAFRTLNPTRLLNTQTLNRTTEGGERVVRAFATWRPNAQHTVDVGVEGAFNFRDTSLDIFNDSGSGKVRQPLAVSNARVEELRGEPFITDVWKLSPTFTLETGFIFEASKIEQTGDETKSREFSYPKPRIIGTWQVTPTDQLRASLVRDVAQLDFAQFASSVNVIDAFSTIGNPNLEPEKTWRVRGEYEKRFGKRGALTVGLFYDDVQDVQDLIVIGASDAYGNLGDGYRTGIEVRGALPLSPMIPNAEMRFSGLWQHTEVTDPLTGRERSFSNQKDWNYLVSFRQDLPSLKSAWGGSVLASSKRWEFKRIEDISYDRPGSRIDMYAETTAVKGLTLRFTVGNIFAINEERQRTFYVGTRASDTLLRTEFRKQKGGPDGTRSFTIRASGSF